MRNTPIFLHDFGPCAPRASWVLRREGGVQNSSLWGISARMLHESASHTCFQFGCHIAGLLAAPRCAHFACTSCCFLLHLTRNKQHGRDLVLNFSYGEQVPPSCTLSTWPRPSFVRSLFLHLHHQLPTIATSLCSCLACPPARVHFGYLCPETFHRGFILPSAI